MNYLTNACKFTQSGTIELSIRIEWHDTQLFLVCALTDSGCGVSAVKKDHLFARVFSVTPEGTGIGLYTGELPPTVVLHSPIVLLFTLLLSTVVRPLWCHALCSCIPWCHRCDAIHPLCSLIVSLTLPEAIDHKSHQKQCTKTVH